MKRLKELKNGSTPQHGGDNNKTPVGAPTQIVLSDGKIDTVIIVAKEEEKTHPDGEWGIVVVMAAFLTQFVVVGLQNSSGVIFNELVKKYDESRGITGKLHEKYWKIFRRKITSNYITITLFY